MSTSCRDLDVIKQVYSLDGILRDAQNFADLVNMVQNRLVRDHTTIMPSRAHLHATRQLICRQHYIVELRGSRGPQQC